MNKTEIDKLLENVATPIYKIEEELGIPKTILQKAAKGKRNLPKKWAIKLKDKYGNPENFDAEKTTQLSQHNEPKKKTKLADLLKDIGEQKPDSELSPFQLGLRKKKFGY